MKYILLLAILTRASFAIAQGDPFVSNINPSSVAGFEAHDLSGKRIPSGKEAPVDGSAMLNEHFEKGTVKFKNGQQFKDVLLNLSLVNNQLYFRKDSTEMMFIIPVEQFTLPVIDEGKAETFLFKSGFPDIHNQTSKTFYHICAEGSKLQLLKYEYKVVREHYSYGGPVKNEYKTDDQLFIYDVTANKISEIRTNAKSLKKALPGYEAEIDKFSSQNKVKFTREDEIKAFVEYVNK